MRDFSHFQSILEPRQHISSKMPYASKRYDLKEFNPVPNELGFLGGLGKLTGNTRSKAHVQRPSLVSKTLNILFTLHHLHNSSFLRFSSPACPPNFKNQILFKMRAANRILFTFSEDPILAHSLTKKQLEGFKSPKQTKNRDPKRDLREKISKIQIADNIIKVSSSKDQRTSSTSGSDVLTKSDVKIDNVSKKSSSRALSLGAMKKISFAFKATDMFTTNVKVPPAPKQEKNFREWALEEREKRQQALQQVSLSLKQEREMANEIFPKSKNSKLPKIFLSGQRKTKKDEIAGAEHLAGKNIYFF